MPDATDSTRRVRALYEEEPGETPLPCRVELEVPLNHECVYLASVAAVDLTTLLNQRQEQEAIERAVRFYATRAGQDRAWCARVRVIRMKPEELDARGYGLANYVEETVEAGSDDAGDRTEG